MPHRLPVVVLIGGVAVLGGGRAVAASSEPPPPDTVPTSENAYLPADGQLSECISALPPPSCGSEARGGWRQTLVMVLVGLALAVIAWRIIRSARRRSPAHGRAEVT
ncbi:MAG: hypothetical protein ACR2HP_08915 [Ilumatobacteraceae bacterium]